MRPNRPRHQASPSARKASSSVRREAARAVDVGARELLCGGAFRGVGLMERPNRGALGGGFDARNVEGLFGIGENLAQAGDLGFDGGAGVFGAG